MNELLLAFAVSLGISLLVLRRSKTGARRLHDHDLSGPQKFHTVPVPRVGGLGIVMGVLAGLCWQMYQAPHVGKLGLVLMACALPAFLSGLTEDLTKNQSPRRRLFFTAASALLATFFLDAVIDRTAIWGLDWLVSWRAGAVLITVFVVAGVANSVNIIDGFNGLASMSSALILVALGYVAFQVGDRPLMYLSLVGVGAVMGFFFWNYPFGLIFLGDGGAYFLGFYVAEIAILLLHRNPEVSPIFPLLVCIYPVFETLFSIYRRVMLRSQPAGMPDGIHLHSLLYRRVMRWAVGSRSGRSVARRNSMVSPYLWMLCMLAIVPAMLFWNCTPIMLGFVLIFGLVYTGLYWRIVRFRVPRWLASRREAR